MGNNYTVRVWAVLGSGSTGKSSVVGNLISQLGKGPGGTKWVPLRGGGYLQINARRQSLQEAKRTKERVVKDAIADARALQKKHQISIAYYNLLVAIRADDGVNGLPPADQYLSYFVDQGWTIESLVILDYNEKEHSKYHAFGAPTLEHYDTSKMVENNKKSEYHWLTGPVRNHLGWA